MKLRVVRTVLLISILFVFVFGTIIDVDAQYLGISQSSKSQIEKLLKKADSLLDKENYKTAIILYDRVLKIEPKNINALDNKGVALISLAKYKEAIRHYDQALRSYPKDEYLLLHKGLALDYLGRYKEAIAAYDKALIVNPKNTDVLNNKAMILSDLGKYDEAISYLDKALKISPNSADMLLNKASIFYKIDEHERAIIYFDNVLKVQPRNSEAMYYKANSLFMLRSFDEAIVYYDKTLELVPNHQYAQYMRDIAHEHLYDFDTNGEINVESSNSAPEEYDGIDELLQGLTDKVEELLYLPDDLTVSTEYCNEANAYYNPSNKKIIMCYEFIDSLRNDMSLFETQEEGTYAITSIFLFTFYHELGHALIDLYDLPVIGKEEDAADHISTLILQALPLSEDEPLANDDIILYAAKWFQIKGSHATSIDSLPFWDEHSFDKQRFYSLVCMVYGSNPEHYQVLVDYDVLPSERQQECIVEYSKISRNMNILLEPYIKS